MISNLQNMVQVRMLHASVYLVPILGPDGAPQVRKVKYFDAEIDAPAAQPVYCIPDDSNGGIVQVPRDVADAFIKNGSAVWPTREVPQVPDGPELTPNAPASVPTGMEPQKQADSTAGASDSSKSTEPASTSAATETKTPAKAGAKNEDPLS